ncbi:MAG TPA: IPT/TIG domain-containing protein [Polyangia bacterium]
MALVVGVCLGACASSGGLQVIPAGELSEGGGQPSVASINDRGGGDIPGSGTLVPVDGDGFATIGEVLHIRGRNFGRQPTVTIGATAISVVSRTEDGGILVRVPPGTPAGEQRLAVTTEGGRGEAALRVRRIAVGRVGPQLYWFDLDPERPKLLGEAAVPNARAVVVSREGRAAYVVDASGALLTYELAAQGSPRAGARLALGQAARGLLAPSDDSRLFVMGSDALIEVDTSLPLRPVLGRSRPLPNWAHGSKALHAAISPDGRRLAIAAGERNRVVVIDVAALQSAAASPAAELALVPEVLAPVLVDLTFAPDGQTLWVLSGASADNQAVGPQSTRVHAVRLTEANGALTLSRARMVQIDAANAPQAIVTGHGLDLQSGAAIRQPPERATVYVAAYQREEPRPQLFSVGPNDIATPAPVLAPVGVMGRPQVSPDEHWLLALTSDPEGANLLLGVRLRGGRAVVVSLPGKPLARALADAPLSSRTSEVRIQP